jgi:mannose-6-phosphate isomerase-like protein (cupin superfamily)
MSGFMFKFRYYTCFNFRKFDRREYSFKAGEISVAKSAQVHGAKNVGVEPFVFISVVAQGKAGYAASEK